MNLSATTAVPTPQWFSRAVQQPLESHYFSFRRARLHYLHWPEAGAVNDADAKPALLFIHGFRGHARWWGFIAPTFIKKYRVYALDLSGMGDSDNTEAYSTTNHSEEILAFIDHLSLTEVTVVAHSFGGGRTFRAARINSGVFKKIIAIDSHVGFAGDIVGKDPAPQKGHKVYPSLADGMARFRFLPPQPDEPDYMREYIARHSLRQLQDGWTWKFDPLLMVDDILRNDGEQVLPQVKCPVDYIYGSQSAIISAALAEKIHAHLANAGRLIAIPNGQHHLMVSHPIELIQILQELL